MNQNELFLRRAIVSDAHYIMNIIQNRCKWLSDNNIEQWNVTKTYNIDYYLGKINDEKFYVAVQDGKIVGTFMLQEKSQYAEYDENIIYIHHLATDINYSGIGKIIIEEIKELAKIKLKKVLRLDNIATNDRLNKYYEENGFKKIATIKKELYDGKNPGILRQLTI